MSRIAVMFMAGLFLLTQGNQADARSFRPALLPNAPDGCNTCHTSGGGTPRNPFGLDVQQLVTPNGREIFWGPALAALDSDGDITSLIPCWIDAGINILYPFEAQCGMDVLEVRKQYGKDLRMWGGVNKRALAIGPGAIDAELARVRPLIEEGGYVPAPDHSLPPDVSFDNYRHYMEKLLDVV